MNANSSILLESGTNELEIVEFRIDEVDDSGAVIPCFFGVNVAKVREIIRLPALNKVPNSPPAIAGMMRLRDRVITLIDLATVLNKGVEGLKPDRVVVLEFNRITVGVLVHSVSRIYRISWEQVEPPVKMIEDSNVTGVVKMDDRIILILDFEKIIAELCSKEALEQIDESDLVQLPELDRSQRTVLVVDDSPFIRHSISSSLRSAGYKVEEAENGEEAWQKINATVERCQSGGESLAQLLSLLITDVEMPQMDGLHLTTLVRSKPELEKLPVLIFSSLASEENKKKWQSLGANGILTKPDLPELVRHADSLM